MRLSKGKSRPLSDLNCLVQLSSHLTRTLTPPAAPNVDRVHATPSVISMANPASGTAPLAEQWKEYVIPGCMIVFAVWWVFA